MLLSWIKRQRDAASLAQADAGALILAEGGNAYAEARRRERLSLIGIQKAHGPRTRAHWRRVAAIIAADTGHDRVLK
jgi:hypothetical protein